MHSDAVDVRYSGTLGLKGEIAGSQGLWEGLTFWTETVHEQLII